MEIKVDSVLVNARGQEVVNDNRPMTVGQACVVALDAALESDGKEGLKPKMRRGRLIETIVNAEANGGRVELSAEDIALIKERIAQTLSSAFLVRKICLHIDPASSE